MHLLQVNCEKGNANEKAGPYVKGCMEVNCKDKDRRHVQSQCQTYNSWKIVILE